MCGVFLIILFLAITSTLSREHGISKRSPVIDNLETYTPMPFTTTEPLPSFCQPFNGTKRDFHRPNRKIYIEKCLEYFWELRERVQAEKDLVKCIQYYNEKYNTRHDIGDYSIEPSAFPHMGAIGWKAIEGKWVFKCGSSLISEKFVLTAAHCTRASNRDPTVADPVPKIVRLGNKNIINVDPKINYLGWKDVNILRIIVHPEYKAPKQYFDIALIELEKEVTFSKLIQPACLRNTVKYAKQATVAGWGVVKTGSLDISPELRAATVDVLDPQQCNDLLNSSCNRNWCGLQDHQLCAGKLDGGVDACQGDSGGPLQSKIQQASTTQGQMHYVIGIISFGVGCAHLNLPGVYTRVGTFIDWIEDIVWYNK